MTTIGRCCIPSPCPGQQPKLPRLIQQLPTPRKCGIKSCQACEEMENGGMDCTCSCVDIRQIVEALAYFFNCSTVYIKSIIFKIAHQQKFPLPQVYRGGLWDVMGGVKAPLTDFHDFIIYDSMYDRCGELIDPTDPDNTFKVVRLMFQITILTNQQLEVLAFLLQRVNDHAIIRINIRKLMAAIRKWDVIEFACSLACTDRLSQNLYNAKICRDICKVYKKLCTQWSKRRLRRKSEEKNFTRKKKFMKKHKKSLAVSRYCVAGPTRSSPYNVPVHTTPPRQQQSNSIIHSIGMGNGFFLNTIEE